MKSVVIRTDSSTTIGSGHTVRCLTLAQALREFGADVSFVSRAAPGDFIGLVENSGFAVRRLVGDATEAADAADTIATLDGWKPDWIVVDHYALGSSWEAASRPHAKKMLAIDDLGRSHTTDALLDQNPAADLEHRYGHLPDGTVRMLGPRFALLQPDYAPLRPSVRRRSHPPRRLLIYFGGGDPGDMTGRALRAFLALQCSDILADVVIGSANPHAGSTRALAAAADNVAVHSGLASLAPLIIAADLSIGAGGATTLERLCLGLPSVVVTVADNQKPVAAELARRGLITWLGDEADLQDDVLEEALRRAIQEPFPDLLAQAPEIDGRGAARVAAYMLLGRDDALFLRPVAEQDERLLLEWANDPQTRAMAFNPEVIVPEVHHAWLARRLADPDSRLFIATAANGVEIGQTRFEHRDGDWIVSYSLDELHRGKGLGEPMLRRAIAALRQAGAIGQLLALVRPENAPSRRIFERLGFTQTAVDARSIAFRHSLQDWT